MRKLYLLLAMLLSFGSTAWADFHQPWTNTPFPWTETIAESELPETLTDKPANVTEYRYATVSVTRPSDATEDVTVKFVYSSGNHGLRIVGVDLLNASGEPVYSAYSNKQAGSNHTQDPIYTLSNVAPGNYTLRYLVCKINNQNEFTLTNGNITVTGLNSKYITSLDDLSNDKVYYFKSGRSKGSSSSYYLLYNSNAAGYLSSTYTSTQAMDFDAQSPNFQFAIYKQDEDFYLYSIEGQKFIGNNTTNLTNMPLVKYPTNAISIKPSADMEYNWVLSTNGFSNGTLHVNPSTYGVSNWNGGQNYLKDGGNTYQICEAGSLSDDLKTDWESNLSNYISWGPTYNNVIVNLNTRTPASDTRVGALTTDSYSSLNNKKNAFDENPTTATYEELETAFNAKQIVSLQEGDVFTILCINDKRGYLAYSESNSTTHAIIAESTGWKTFPSKDDEGVSINWAYKEKDGKKYLYNYDQTLFIGTGKPAGETADCIPFNQTSYVTITPDESNPLIHRILFNNSTSTKLTLAPAYEGINSVRAEGGTDDGVQFYLDKIEGKTDLTSKASITYEKTVLKNRIDWVNTTNTIGTDLGQYNNSDGTGSAVVAQALNVFNDANATEEEITQAQTKVNAITINQPTTGKLYRFKCTNDAKERYLTSNILQSPVTSSPKYLLNTIPNENKNSDYTYTVFYLTPDKKLLSYKEGLYIGSFAQNQYSTENQNNPWTLPGVSQDGAVFSFAEGTIAGKYKLRPNGNRELCVNKLTGNSTTEYLIDAASTGQTSEIYNWTIEEVKWLPIPVSDTYMFGTLTSPVPLEIISNDGTYGKDARMKFYTATIGEDNYVVLTKVEDNIPANVPLVIELVTSTGMSQGSQFMQIASSAPELDVTNVLKGSFETIVTPTDQGTIYTLQAAWVDNTEDNKSATNVAFRLYNGANIQGFRAYLPVASGTEPAGMRFYEGDVTRIEGVEEGQTHKVDVYDLSGRRVQRATKGLYIVNGKKVLVK